MPPTQRYHPNLDGVVILLDIEKRTANLPQELTRGLRTAYDLIYGLRDQLTSTPLTKVFRSGYTTSAADNQSFLIFNSASAITLSLPGSPPFNGWRIAVQNVGAGTLTVSRSGLTIDAVAANLTITQNHGTLLTSDGSNYFTERGF